MHRPQPPPAAREASPEAASRGQQAWLSWGAAEGPAIAKEAQCRQGTSAAKTARTTAKRPNLPALFEDLAKELRPLAFEKDKGATRRGQ